MEEMVLTVEAAIQIEKDLKKAGIRISIEEPTDEDTFEITVEDGGDIRLYPAEVNLKVFPDKSHKQAIMWADEKGHTTERDIKIRRSSDSYTRRQMTLKKYKIQMEEGRHFPIGLPEGTVFTVIEGPTYTEEPNDFSVGGEPYRYVEAKVRAVVPDNKWTFLLGTDESSQFISALPKRVKTIDAAHKSLRPAGITVNTERQGEWFFVPATDVQARAIERMIAEDPTVIKARWLGAANDNHHMNHRVWDVNEEPDHGNDDDTTHVGMSTVFYLDNLFATGYVVDDRRPEGRSSRHDPLWLPDWHKVVHNLEITVPGMDQDGFD